MLVDNPSSLTRSSHQNTVHRCVMATALRCHRFKSSSHSRSPNDHNHQHQPHRIHTHSSMGSLCHCSFLAPFTKFSSWIGTILTILHLASSVFAQHHHSLFREIRIQQGLLRGMHMKTINGQDFYGFIGVPYATAPVGNLRFRVRNTARDTCHIRLDG